MIQGIKGIYFDFGYVIGYPKSNIEKKYLYLDWDGLEGLFRDESIRAYLKPGVGLRELTQFFEDEIYHLFVEHEKTDLLDPQSGVLLETRLPALFTCTVTEELIDKVLSHVNTMKYLDIDPKAKPILEYIKDKGFLLSMISNMMLPGKLLVKKLEDNDIAHFFNTITVSSDIGFIKPRLEMFEETLKKDDLRPEEVLFIGDTYAQDMIGAKKAGMRTLWLNCRSESLLDTSCADYEIKKLDEIMELL